MPLLSRKEEEGGREGTGLRCAGPRDDVLKAKSCFTINDKYEPSLQRDEASTARRK